MAELDELRAALKTLEDQHQQEKTTMNETFERMQQALTDQGEEQSRRHDRPVAIVQSRDRRLRKFNGDRNDFEGWELDARGAIGGLGEEEQADLLFSKLEGAPRREILCCGDRVKKDPIQILAALGNVFGGRAEASHVLTEFWARDQRPQESIADYSHKLMEVLERLEQADPAEVRNQNDLLKKKFKAGVVDRTLRWELSRFNIENSDAPFITMREVALKWEQGADKMTKVKSAATEASPYYGMKEMQIQMKNLLCQMEEHREEMKKQAASLELLKSSLSSSRKVIKCFYCEKPGHIKSQCYKRIAEMERGENKSKSNVSSAPTGNNATTSRADF